MGQTPLIILEKASWIEPIMDLNKESLIKLICHHCEFYKESDKDLECGAFKILRALLKKGAITPGEIQDALRE